MRILTKVALLSSCFNSETLGGWVNSISELSLVCYLLYKNGLGFESLFTRVKNYENDYIFLRHKANPELTTPPQATLIVALFILVSFLFDSYTKS